MPNRPFYPPAWQIPALLDGRAPRVCVPLKPQPDREIFLWPPRLVSGKAIFENNHHGTGLRQDVPLPFAPGDTLLCGEAWMPAIHGEVPLIVYKAGGERQITVDQFDTVNNGRTGWRSPATLRSGWRRLRQRVIDMAVKRTTDLSPADAIACGFGPYANSLTIDCDTRNPLDDLRAAWNQQHARTPGLAYADRPWVATGRVERVEG